MAQSTRTFVAIPVPEPQAAKLGRLRGLIAAEVPDARWVDPKQLHATLAFLGDVPDGDLAKVCRAVGEAAAGFGPMSLVLERLGCFPSPAKPHTLWVGLEGPGVDPLCALQKAVASALQKVGYPADDRFSPHVTLARLKAKRGRQPDLRSLIDKYKAWTAGSFTVGEVVTFASTTTSEGPIYAPLSRVRLEKGNRGASA